jgi:hypothetical protein
MTVGREIMSGKCDQWSRFATEVETMCSGRGGG